MGGGHWGRGSFFIGGVPPPLAPVEPPLVVKCFILHVTTVLQENVVEFIENFVYFCSALSSILLLFLLSIPTLSSVVFRRLRIRSSWYQVMYCAAWRPPPCTPYRLSE